MVAHVPTQKFIYNSSEWDKEFFCIFINKYSIIIFAVTFVLCTWLGF